MESSADLRAEEGEWMTIACWRGKVNSNRGGGSEEENATKRMFWIEQKQVMVERLRYGDIRIVEYGVWEFSLFVEANMLSWLEDTIAFWRVGEDCAIAICDTDKDHKTLLLEGFVGKLTLLNELRNDRQNPTSQIKDGDKSIDGSKWKDYP
ncbi:hypothetical protein Scep_006650 [Stephania cephalantha]|uniref:Uncharacterized protein n=1 Tax=Stephania cephalantha TaxID=152367 RepID=A0AAP0PKA3_9MAGN